MGIYGFLSSPRIPRLNTTFIPWLLHVRYVSERGPHPSLSSPLNTSHRLKGGNTDSNGETSSGKKNSNIPPANGRQLERCKPQIFAVRYVFGLCPLPIILHPGCLHYKDRGSRIKPSFATITGKVDNTRYTPRN